MDLRGEHRFDASRSVVWAALIDPETLERALPGCERFERVGPDSYDVTLRVGMSAVRGTYSGNVTIDDMHPPDSYRLTASGGGRPGRLRGEAAIRLVDDGEGTGLSYDAEVRAEGPIARLGSRILGAAAKTMARRFFSTLEEHMQEAVH